MRGYMRKIILQNAVTLDGFFEGSQREIDWHTVDEEFNEYAIDLLKHLDTLLFGRITYELMADYWPTAAAMRDDPIVAERMNNLAKVVFSTSLKNVEWNNTRLVKGDIVEEVSRLKQQPGMDMAIFGSSDLSVPLVNAGLIDEYRLFVNPLFLGSGKTLFKGLNKRLNLKLVKNLTLKSGVVGLFYTPA
jgi:dihydrofolate reductase